MITLALIYFDSVSIDFNLDFLYIGTVLLDLALFQMLNDIFSDVERYF